MEGYGTRGEGEEGEGCRCAISGGDGPLGHLMQYWRDEGEVRIESVASVRFIVIFPGSATSRQGKSASYYICISINLVCAVERTIP